MDSEDFILSKASSEHIPEIEELIAESVRYLARASYTEEQIEAALESAWGVDTQLILDGTYFVVYQATLLVACGGWSYRETLFGNDAAQKRNDTTIDPMNGAAKIRAFFVKPAFARRGLGSRLMRKCETEALKMGYQRLELMATLPGQKLYEKHGFIAEASIEYELSDGLFITFVPMKRELV